MSYYLVFAARSAIALSCYEAIAPVQAFLIHVIVGGAVDRSYPVGNRSFFDEAIAPVQASLIHVIERSVIALH
ncbi:MAG TPA: hypothetical protein DCL61_14595 [Cyanobacteria bacterium UBA12227]|nr:hypothetical protein [Cyanobacteria bacterium UBA12227]HAX85270.1 hypothetical protein [Cyanobacteria bacterium UBA11370]HBY77821.1 hypothetical protein [Cyanobacteria bacterium UBA11148]